MGCDGGTIPKRDELVRTKKKPEQKDKNSELVFKWKHCAISQEALGKRIVSCELGRLYNKESVLEFLLDRSKFEVAAQFDHLRGLKDIKELKLTDNPEKRSKDAEKGDGYIDSGVSDYICPVVGLEMSGKYRFCFLWSCGCALSERALREVKTETCHKCGKPFKEEDVIVLNGSEEEVAELRSKMENRRAQAKASKKSKKGKHKLTDKIEEEPSTSSSSKKVCAETTESSSSSTPSPPPEIASTSDDSQPKISNGIKKVGASLSKTGIGKHIVNGKSSLVNGKSSDDKAEKGKEKKCIQKDPTASKTFKSLFTTSEAAKNQQQPHWVTYNPMYY